jgi:hypothetical protein
VAAAQTATIGMKKPRQKLFNAVARADVCKIDGLTVGTAFREETERGLHQELGTSVFSALDGRAK